MQPQDSIHVTDAASAQQLRVDAIDAIGLRSGSVIESLVNSPLANVPNLSQVVKLSINCDDIQTAPHLYRTASSNGVLVIVHQGHSGNHENYGIGDLVRSLVASGCDVLLCIMIGGTEQTGGSGSSHAGTQLWQHLSQIKVAVDHVAANYQHIYMTGISGGGWATVVYGGIDARIERSVSIAGYFPLYIGGINRDTEQLAVGSLPVSYLDLAILAARNGRHVQLLHTNDQCCFTLAQYQSAAPYHDDVDTIAASIGGSYAMRWVAQSEHVVSVEDREIVLQEFGLMEVPPVTTEVIIPVQQCVVTPGWTWWADKQVYSCPNGAGESATWNAPHVGTIAVFADWTIHANRATNSPYRIYDGQSLLAEVRVNQEAAPSNGFELLGTFPFFDSVRVVLGNDANEYVIAKNIKLVIQDETPPPPPPASWSAFTGSRDEWLALPSVDARIVNGVCEKNG